MADPVRDEEHAPAVKPEDIRRKTFSTTRRGYDQTMVDTYLRSVAETLRDAQKREAEMRTRLGKAVRKADEAVRRADEAVAKARAAAAVRPKAEEPTEEELTARLGAEVAQVLESARAAAEERTARAAAESEQVRSQAAQQSEHLLNESQAVLDLKTQEAATAATRIIDAADQAATELTAEAEAVVERAQHAGLDHLRQAQVEGEGIVTQAEAARRQILKDMDRRRRSMRAQVEQLRAARDRLLESHSVVQTTLDEAKQELKHSLIEAKVRGEGAARQAGEARYLNHEELENEVADSVLVGRIELPEIEFRDEVAYQQILGARPEEIEGAESPQAKVSESKTEVSEPKAKAESATAAETTNKSESTNKSGSTKSGGGGGGGAAKSTPQAGAQPKQSTTKSAPADGPQWADDELSSDPFAEPADLVAVPAKAEKSAKGAKSEAPEVSGLADEIIAALDESQAAVKAKNAGTAKPADQKPVDPSQEAKKSEPKKSEASKSEAKKSEPKTAESKKAEPKKSEAKKSGPGTAEQKQAEPKKPEAKDAGTGHPAGAPQLRLVKTPEPTVDAVVGGDVDDLPAERVEIDDLFARIRSRDADRDSNADGASNAEGESNARGEGNIELDGPSAPGRGSAPAGDVRKFQDPDPDEAEWEFDEEELPAAARADAIDLAATRDEAICDVEVEVGRRLKRILADEQNVLLEATEQSFAGPLVDVLPDLDKHVGLYLDAVVSQLENAIAAGAMFVEPAAASPKLLRSHFEPAVRNLIVEPIRERLGEVVPNDDVDAAKNAVRGFYREHKRDNVGAAGVFMVLHAFARGTVGTVDQGVGVRWVFIEADRGCPDGHDNELAGPMAVGEVFPSGAQMPPLAPGCRCLLVPADR